MTDDKWTDLERMAQFGLDRPNINISVSIGADRLFTLIALARSEAVLRDGVVKFIECVRADKTDANIELRRALAQSTALRGDK